MVVIQETKSGGSTRGETMLEIRETNKNGALMLRNKCWEERTFRSSFNITTLSVRDGFQASLMNTIVRGYISGAECARTRILLTVNSLPAGAESFLANCQTPPNHELLIPARPMYSNVLSHGVRRGSKIPEFRGTDSKHRSRATKCQERSSTDSSDRSGTLAFNDR